MCYTVSFIERKAAAYAERYKNEVPIGWIDTKLQNEELPLGYFVSGFSHPQLPIVKHDGIEMFEWGLIPAWTKSIEDAKKLQNNTLNAKGETVFEKPSFKKSILSQRCILPIAGFFEWMHLGNSTYPYFVSVSNESIFSIACIYEWWVNKNTNETHKTFSMLTTPANLLMEKIHNTKKRMPLILNRIDEASWLNPKLTITEIEQLIRPFETEMMQAHTVSRKINSQPEFTLTKECLKAVEYPELAFL